MTELNPADMLTLIEALKDAQQYRASLAVARPVLNAGKLEDIDADADAARAYKRLLDEIRNVDDYADGESVRLDQGRALLAAEALNDGASYIITMSLIFNVCECCQARRWEYEALEERITAPMGKIGGRM